MSNPEMIPADVARAQAEARRPVPPVPPITSRAEALAQADARDDVEAAEREAAAAQRVALLPAGLRSQLAAALSSGDGTTIPAELAHEIRDAWQEV